MSEEKYLINSIGDKKQVLGIREIKKSAIDLSIIIRPSPEVYLRGKLNMDDFQLVLGPNEELITIYRGNDPVKAHERAYEKELVLDRPAFHKATGTKHLVDVIGFGDL